MMNKGFSLIEIVLVMVVISIASLGVVVAMQQTMLDIHKPQVISLASALATKEAERVITLSFANVTDENRDSPASYSGDYSSYSWEIRVDSIDDQAPSLGSDANMTSYKVVDARVHHTVIGNISIKTLKTNH